MKIRPRQLIIGIALSIALGATAWATWAYQNSQNEIEVLQKEVERLTQKKRELQKEIQSTFRDIVNTATESAVDSGTPETAVPQTTPTALRKGPQLTVEPKVLDLGTIRKAEGPRTGTFNLKNTGGSDLLLKTVLSSCGCTTVEVKNVTVAPGTIYELPVTYDPNYFGPKLELGPVEKWIAILSNDQENSITKIYLKANVIP